MSKISCKINLGTRMQKIFIEQSPSNITTYEVLLKDIPDFILDHKNINEVYISGQKDFIKKIEEKTKEKEIKKYNQTKIIFHYI